jgi:hypothetical protein
LKTFRGVSGQSDGKPVWGYFKLRLEKFSKGGVNMSMTLSNFSPEQAPNTAKMKLEIKFS